MKTGLVLEGGAMREMFSAGIMDVMMEYSVEFDGIIGVSAGASFGCNYKSKQRGRTIRYNLRFAGDPRYCSLSSLIRTGDLYNAEFCYNKIPNELDPFDYNTFNNNPTEFYVVASDLETGKAIYKKLDTCDKEQIRWIQASASMPIVSRPVHIDGYTLLDGGMTDSIPLQYFQNIGYEKNIVILTQPRNFIKKKHKPMWLTKISLRKYPKLIEAMAQRHIMYNNETAYVFEQEKRGDTLVLCPPEPLNISRTESNPHELERIYELGKKLAHEHITEIIQFCKK